MITTELQQEIKRYLPAITLDRIFPRFLRLRLEKILTIFIVTLFIFQGLLFGADALLSTIGIVEPSGTLTLFLSFSVPLYGILLVVLSLGFVLLMLESFFNAVYFRGTRYRREDTKSSEKAPLITYEVADILSRSYSDLTGAFVSSRYGKEILARCNIHKKDLRTFLEGERTKILPKALMLPQKDFFSLSALSHSVIEHDKAFADFLFGHGVSESVFSGSVAWVARVINEDKEGARWWARENLSRIQGIGKDWGYGGAYQLVRFAKDIALGSVFSSLGESSNYRKDKVEQLEIILARTKEANALLVGEQGVGKRDIIIQLQQKIESGAALPQLEDKRMLALDSDLFIATYGDKTSFERELLILLGQAHDAGNIILVIENMTAFIRNAEAIGSDIVAIMDPYFSGTELQVLATSDPVSFHKVLEARPQLMQRFEVVQAEGANQAVTIRVIEDIARIHEKQFKLFFTYSAIETILESADRYIVGGVMPDKAVDLLIELLPVAMSKKVRIITKEFVYEYVKEKTGIPVGAVSEEERDILLHLEDILHKRIVGQDQAVVTISNAMRRARAGIQNPDRPLGSFLFLGPTGVGKTETTKALAEVFFGDEDKMLRLDMSEYATADALERLIGSADTDSVGILVTMLKEKPHGVLLLDEFEKTITSVKDLFLQILDEGFFGSARGERISARNLIIIATSNAGSDLIWEYSKEGKDLIDVKENIIEGIITQGVYKPELLNRFDGVVLFHALNEKHLKKIAILLLGHLQERIKKQGYLLVVNDMLANVLVKKGFSPQFGARPMQRVLQDLIEKKIAEKIIEGALKPGASITFTKEDFQ